ncbi:MAG: VCBS repeat-containing protein [Verrucomicrobiales bacterium]|nr:VCBS repeat-containing protein [Verrucomicrobiales bacterium]
MLPANLLSVGFTWLWITVGVLTIPIRALSADPAPAASSVVPGVTLVERTCQSCHIAPELDALDRQTWVKETLRFMAPWLGLSRLNYDSQPDGPILRDARIHPDEPVFSREEWQAVVGYFASNAPIQLPPPPPGPLPREGIPGFATERFVATASLPFVTLLRIEPDRQRLLIGDGQDRSLRALDRQGKTLWHLPVPSGPVSIATTSSRDAFLLTLIGRVFPSDEPAGQIWRVVEQAGQVSPTLLLKGLRRPVHASYVDLDGDGNQDVVVSAFGNRLGNLSWFRGKPDGSFQERVLEEYPGTLRTLPIDWNRDGRLDLLVLRAQAREGISVLLNDGDSTFQPRHLVNFPPTFGAVSLDLADVDGDGSEDFLVVNGDSGDYASPHKPYHGLRIYSRQGEDRLVLRTFLPVHGAYGTRARDFDGDGDLDLAVIAFFPDFNEHPSGSFRFYRNLGGLKFEAFALPRIAAEAGRWLVMDAGDLDGDGDDDIVLGSFFRGPPTVPIPASVSAGWESNRLAVMLLRNTRR